MLAEDFYICNPLERYFYLQYAHKHCTLFGCVNNLVPLSQFNPKCISFFLSNPTRVRDALQAQINPHFLFNTLNTICMFIRTDPTMARKLLERFAAFLRISLRQKAREITLKEELRFLNNYLILEKARFRDKLCILRRIDKELLDYFIPVLSIQPLVENAVRHGITPKEGKGTIEITARRNDQEELEIIIRDDGVGIDPEIMPRVLEPGFGSGSGVGLSNVNQRLMLLYGEEYDLKISSEPGIGTQVVFRIPMKMKGDSYDIKISHRG